MTVTYIRVCLTTAIMSGSTVCLRIPCLAWAAPPWRRNRSVHFVATNHLSCSQLTLHIDMCGWEECSEHSLGNTSQQSMCPISRCGSCFFLFPIKKRPSIALCHHASFRALGVPITTSCHDTTPFCTKRRHGGSYHYLQDLKVVCRGQNPVRRTTARHQAEPHPATTCPKDAVKKDEAGHYNTPQAKQYPVALGDTIGL